MVASLPSNLAEALSFAFAMTWEILWALVIGFALSAAVQAVVSKNEMTRLLPDDSPRSLVIVSGLGAASSSCSYAAVALADRGQAGALREADAEEQDANEPRHELRIFA